jgi:hypothetical protein
MGRMRIVLPLLSCSLIVGDLPGELGYVRHRMGRQLLGPPVGIQGVGSDLLPQLADGPAVLGERGHIEPKVIQLGIQVAGDEALGIEDRLPFSILLLLLSIIVDGLSDGDISLYGLTAKMLDVIVGQGHHPGPEIW